MGEHDDEGSERGDGSPGTAGSDAALAPDDNGNRAEPAPVRPRSRVRSRRTPATSAKVPTRDRTSAGLVVAVTGAASGVGRALAAALVGHPDVRKVVGDRRPPRRRARRELAGARRARAGAGPATGRLRRGRARGRPRRARRTRTRPAPRLARRPRRASWLRLASSRAPARCSPRPPRRGVTRVGPGDQRDGLRRRPGQPGAARRGRAAARGRRRSAIDRAARGRGDGRTGARRSTPGCRSPSCARPSSSARGSTASSRGTSRRRGCSWSRTRTRTGSSATSTTWSSALVLAALGTVEGVVTVGERRAT